MKRWMVLPLTLLCGAANAQSNWAFQLVSQSTSGMNAIVVDGAGNSYVTGEFSGLVNLGGPSLISNGGLDVVVMKLAPDGALLWSRSFGGPGLDRGIALALGPSGDLVVTGQFMGNVAFGGQTLTSLGGTQDIFVLRMQSNDGSVLWARQGGSADGVDQPTGVSVGPDGSIVVTGEFRGTAVFDGGTLTSMEDPDTEAPSVDVFIAAYTAAGAPLWLKHGATKKAARGVAVAHDPVGNVYVTGQFSDTLMLDQSYPNAMFNAVFLTCYNAAGTQQWLRVFGGGVYNHVHGLRVVEGNRLMLLGDMQGTVIFLDSQPDLFTASAPKSSFLMEVGLDGEFIRQINWGSANTLQTKAFSVQGNEVLVFGRFHCQLTDFSAIYGDGIFIAMGMFDMYVARFELADLIFKDAQQFGSEYQKHANGIAHLPGGEPVFCGAFKTYLYLPNGDPEEFIIHPSGNVMYWDGLGGAPGFCGDPHYPFYGIMGTGVYGPMSGFITKGWVEGRQPFDFFRREEGGPCVRDIPPIRITHGGEGDPDSIMVCGPTGLWIAAPAALCAGSQYQYCIGPLVTVEWSNGSAWNWTQATETGWYVATVTLPGGCMQWVDSLHVTVVPFGDMSITADTDVTNYFYHSYGSVYEAGSCDPFWMWGFNITPGHTLQIGVPDGSASVVQGDSVLVVDGGEYGMSITGPEGCVGYYHIFVNFPPSLEPIPPIEVDARLYKYDGLTEEYVLVSGDTVYICPGGVLYTEFRITYMLDGDTIVLPDGLYAYNSPIWGSLPDAPEGWAVRTFDGYIHNGPCGQDTLFHNIVDSVYVIYLPPGISLSLTFTGPEFLCNGDTATVVANYAGFTNFSWSGPHIVADLGDSIRVNGPGSYGITINDTLPPCSSSPMTDHHLQWGPSPVLHVQPYHGVLCPDSTALIYTLLPGTDFQWYGPLGPLADEGSSIVTTQVGYYYLEMVNAQGCLVASDPVFLSGYATPFLNVTPSNTLCDPGDEASLQVVTTGQSTLQWLPPLSGNSTWQTVSQPGVYSCQVTSCGITTVVSVEIFGNTTVTELTTEGPYGLCEGDELQLQVLPGNLATYWMPGFIPGPLLNVTSGGVYTLVAVDLNGCEAELAVVVEQFDYGVGLSVSDTVVCAGAPVTLVAAGSGQIIWYADAGLQVPLGTGNVLDLGTVTMSQTVYVQQTEGPCTSDAVAVNVVVFPQPSAPFISGPTEVCTGQDVTLTVIDPDADQYLWSTPLGDLTGNPLLLPQVDLSAAGPYQVTAYNGPCAATGPEHILQVEIAQGFTLGPDTSFCNDQGNALVLAVPPGYSDPEWSTGSTEATITVNSSGTYVLNVLDANGCPVSASVTVEVIECMMIVPNMLTPNGDGVNDVLLLEAPEGSRLSLEVVTRFGQRVAFLEGSIVAWDGRNTFIGEPLSEGTYFYVLKITDRKGDLTHQQGYVTLMR